MTEELRQYLYSRMEELPTLPVVVTRVLALANDPKSGAGDVAELVSRDPALAAKVLKAANSAYYGFSRQIDTLRHAATLLGLKMTRALALSVGVFEVLPRAAARPLFSHEGLWKHSIGVGVLAQDLAQRGPGGLGRGEREDLFLVGLLHDVGKVVLDLFFGERFQTGVERAASGPPGRLPEVEREVLGADHGEVAGLLLSRWRFPPSLIGPIADQHRLEASAGTDPRPVALLRVANSLAQELSLGPEGNAAPNPLRPADLALLGLGEAELNAVRDAGETVRADAEAFFSAVA